MDFTANSAVPSPSCCSLSVTQRGLRPKVSKTQTGFQALQVSCFVPVSRCRRKSQHPPPPKTHPSELGGCTGEGTEDLLGHQVTVDNSLLPCKKNPSGDASSAVAVATARFPSLSSFQLHLTHLERQLLEASARGEEKTHPCSNERTSPFSGAAMTAAARPTPELQTLSWLVSYPLIYPGTCQSLRGGCEVEFLWQLRAAFQCCEQAGAPAATPCRWDLHTFHLWHRGLVFSIYFTLSRVSKHVGWRSVCSASCPEEAEVIQEEAAADGLDPAVPWDSWWFGISGCGVSAPICHYSPFPEKETCPVLGTSSSEGVLQIIMRGN